MILSTTSYTDPLELSTVKAHLNVGFDDDDSLISQYMKASLRFVEVETNRLLVQKTFVSTVDEVLNAIERETIKLKIPYRPVYIKIDDEKIDNQAGKWYWEGGTLTIKSNKTEITSIEAIINVDDNDSEEINLITQARLMLIANWYAFREADYTGNINEIPTGVTRILSILSDPSI